MQAPPSPVRRGEGPASKKIADRIARLGAEAGVDEKEALKRLAQGVGAIEERTVSRVATRTGSNARTVNWPPASGSPTPCGDSGPAGFFLCRKGPRPHALAVLNLVHQGWSIPLARAQVEKANAHRKLVVNGLDHTAKPEGQAVELELGFDFAVGTHDRELFRWCGCDIRSC